MHIAWRHVSEQHLDELPKGVSRIHKADIEYENGVSKLVNLRLLIDRCDLPFKCTIETQNFVPPHDRELSFSAYGYQRTEVCVVDLKTKRSETFLMHPTSTTSRGVSSPMANSYSSNATVRTGSVTTMLTFGTTHGRRPV